MNNILNKIVEYIKKNILIIIIITMIIGLYYLNFINNNKENIEKDNKSIVKNTIAYEEIKIETEYIQVDVKGYVKKPGVYKLEKGSRCIDAINMAGGLIKNANTRFINLSKQLNDGEVIVIYSNDEIKKAQKSNTIYVETPCICEEVKNDACITNNETNNSNNLININTASIGELMTLTGIGESKAKSIIQYRDENGLFKTIDDIMKVSGISETIYEKIKNNITI